MAAANNRDYKTITEIRELREETLKKIGAREKTIIEAK